MSKDSHFTGQPVCQVLQGTDAAKHDHYLLKEVHLPKDFTLAMDRGYVDNRTSRFISSMGTASTPCKYRHGWF